VDTDVLIWILRGRGDVIERFKKLIEQTGGEVYITPIQIAEIYAGARPSELEIIERFLSSFGVLKINAAIGKRAGEIVNRYGKSHGVKLADAFIAAAAEFYDTKLWTFNVKHYPTVKERFLKENL
jgi:predicted nucleic acid-binding protein